MFWIILTLSAALAGLWIALPFLRTRSLEMNTGDSTLSIYRDQIDEIEHDLAQGLISAQECDAARREIERRALKAARGLDQGFTRAERSIPAVIGVVAVAMAVTLGGYAWLGKPDQGDLPLVARKTEDLLRRAQGGDLNSQIALLVEATQKDPADVDSWGMLAQTYAAVEDYASAAEAYRRAIALDPKTPELQAAYGEALTLANGNKVPPAARVVFEQILRDTPDPRARYYLALAKAQAQDFEGALADWTALAQGTPRDAPWQPLVRRDIVNMVKFLGGDLLDHLPDASPQEITASGGTVQVAEKPADHPSSNMEAVDKAIAERRAQLAVQPKDYKAAIDLARLLAVKDDWDGAAAALIEGRAAYDGAPFVQKLFDEAAMELGLADPDIAAVPADDVRSPTAEQIEDISALEQEEQDEMIDGMVAGLAERLADNPDNPGGWIMLVRSYVTLGAMDRAQAAYAAALAQFAGNEAVLKRLRTEAGILVAGQ